MTLASGDIVSLGEWLRQPEKMKDSLHTSINFHTLSVSSVNSRTLLSISIIFLCILLFVVV